MKNILTMSSSVQIRSTFAWLIRLSVPSSSPIVPDLCRFPNFRNAKSHGSGRFPPRVASCGRRYPHRCHSRHRRHRRQLQQLQISLRPWRTETEAFLLVLQWIWTEQLPRKDGNVECRRRMSQIESWWRMPRERPSTWSTNGWRKRSALSSKNYFGAPFGLSISAKRSAVSCASRTSLVPWRISKDGVV